LREYELMLVMHPTITDEQMPEFLDQIAGYIITRGGAIHEYRMEAPWGRRRLAYPIDDQTEGFYTLFKYRLDPAQVGEVDRDLRLNENVLRFLITRPDEVAAPEAADAPDEAATPAEV
jgi:small subunit ribosomal protein S6